MGFNIKELLERKKKAVTQEDDIMIILRKLYDGNEAFSYSFKRGILTIQAHPAIKHYFRKNKKHIQQAAREKDVTIRDIL